MEHHVFISYATLDDKPLPDKKNGWVANFYEALINFLSTHLGEKVSVWRAPGMPRNADFDEEIFDNLLKSLTFVSVVTPSYINSDYCLEELRRFRDEIASKDKQTRIFKVEKTPVDINEVKKFFPGINGFLFYKFDEQKEKPREFGLDYGESKDFYETLGDLSYEIAQLVKLIKKNKLTEASPDKPAQEADDLDLPEKPTAVYLALTSSDFENERDNIRRDLQERGYIVLPPGDAVKPDTTEEFKSFVRENIQRCSVAVHLISKDYSESPKDGEKSYIHLQTMVAAERDQDPNFARIIWLPRGVNKDDQQQNDFINQIWKSTAKGVEILEKPLEEVKTNILETLAEIKKLSSQPVNTTAKPSILVLYDKDDMKSALEIEEHIKKQDFTVWTAKEYLLGKPFELIDAQKKYLRNCDGVLIYWKDATDYWMQIILRRVKKIFGEGRDEPFLGKGIFTVGDNIIDLFDDDIKANFISDFDQLDTFLKKVKIAFQAKN
jgi:hypothetical protein